MKLIIDIPEDVYEWLKLGYVDINDKARLVPLVKSGIPFEELEDCISRKEALDICSLYAGHGCIWWQIKSLPPVKPAEKVGQWKWEQEPFTKNKNWGNWHCSECRKIITVCETDWAEINKPIYKYCPNCGIKMQTESENEE